MHDSQDESVKGGGGHYILNYKLGKLGRKGTEQITICRLNETLGRRVLQASLKTTRERGDV